MNDAKSVASALGEAGQRIGFEFPEELAAKISDASPAIASTLGWSTDPKAVASRAAALEGFTGWASIGSVAGRNPGLRAAAAAAQVPWVAYLPLLSPAILLFDVPLLMLAAAYLSQSSGANSSGESIDGASASVDPLGAVFAMTDAVAAQTVIQAQQGSVWRMLMAVLDAAWLFVSWGENTVSDNRVDIFEEHALTIQDRRFEGVQLNTGILSSAGLVGPSPEGLGWLKPVNYYLGNNAISSNTVIGGVAGYLTISPDIVTGCRFEHGCLIGMLAAGLAGPEIEGCHVSGNGLRTDLGDNYQIALFEAAHFMQQATGSAVADSVLCGKGLWSVIAGCDRARIQDCRIEGDHDRLFAGIGIAWLGNYGASTGCEFKCNGQFETTIEVGNVTCNVVIPVPFPAIVFAGQIEDSPGGASIYRPETQGNLVEGAQMSFCWPFWDDDPEIGHPYRSPIWNYGNNPMPPQYEPYDPDGTGITQWRWTNRIYWESCWYWKAGQLADYLLRLVQEQILQQL